MAKEFTRINLSNLIYPYFLIEKGKKEKIRNFPGIFRFSEDFLLRDIAESIKLGLGKILLFGIPGGKSSEGIDAYSEDNVVARSIRKIKAEFPKLIVMTDVCLCAYTDHGHCGVLDKERKIDNKKTLGALAEMALSHARAGADWVAPSAMAKKQVIAIRKALDKEGFFKVKILGYSAKFNSNFYGPFRNAAGSAPRFGDRSNYQLDYTNAGSAISEIEQDIKEGADMVMVKPALSYLDIIKEAKQRFKAPLAAYNVSGEYEMVKLYSRQPDTEKRLVAEILTGIKRAGADFIITYHAKDIAKWQKEN